MDFEIAANRLKKDQQSALARSRASRNARTSSAKAKREAQLSRAKAEKRLKEKKLESKRTSKIVGRIERGVGRVERGLGVSNVAPNSTTTTASSDNQNNQSTQSSSSSLFPHSPLASGWTFSATSIHGEGDKIALPPSVLETMTSGNNDLDPWGSGGYNGRPIAFRIGILNPDYKGFPCGQKMKALVEDTKKEIIASDKNALLGHQNQPSSIESSQNNGLSNNNKADDDDDMEGMSDDETNDSRIIEAYLEELSHRYLSYTHGTVVEFTQENGCVGLPEPIARALLQPNKHSLVGISKNNSLLNGERNAIPTRRTVDPASAAVIANDGSVNEDLKQSLNNEMKDAMDVDIDTTPNNQSAAVVDTGEKTPGHLAYGLFDVPSLPIEVIPISRLPPGKNCTFTPTASSIQNGFYGLKDIKSVLEQSLMRTRATLSKGDIIRTWRRGVSFDLIVSSLSPGDYGAVSCINTNLNVDIGPPEGGGDDDDEANGEKGLGSNDAKKYEPRSIMGGGGRLLSEPPPSRTKLEQSTTSPIAASVEKEVVELPPEPAENVKEGVCNIQIRGRTPSGTSSAGRRRFDIATATMGDLFAFASNICDGAAPLSFRLVTRFPRRVFQISSSSLLSGEGYFDKCATLESAGICQGQEMFMVELV